MAEGTAIAGEDVTRLQARIKTLEADLAEERKQRALVEKERDLLERDLEKVINHSQIDHRTGAYTKEALEGDLKKLVNEYQKGKTPQGSTTVIFIDLCSLKKHNETLGHTGANQLINEVSEFIKSNLRSEEKFPVSDKRHDHRLDSVSIYRHGGDEFVIKFAGSAEAAEKAMRRIRERMHQHTFNITKNSNGAIIPTQADFYYGCYQIPTNISRDRQSDLAVKDIIGQADQVMQAFKAARKEEKKQAALKLSEEEKQAAVKSSGINFDNADNSPTDSWVGFVTTPGQEHMTTHDTHPSKRR